MSSFFPSLPATVRICGQEAFLGSRKFLVREGVLFTIRDRESDPDYSEDEEWSFDAWCGSVAAEVDQAAFEAQIKNDDEADVGNPGLPTSADDAMLLQINTANRLLEVMAAATKPWTTIHCPTAVVSGPEISTDKRHEMFGQVGGGAASTGIEIFQRRMLEEGVGVRCAKTNTRINLRNITLNEVPHPNKVANGFDYSEDFDGVQKIGGSTVYINLKCVVGKGGSQTRSLREVYWFVEGQLKFLRRSDVFRTYFANILDGDEAAHTMDKFKYLLSQREYVSVRENIYVGDLRSYFDWIKGRLEHDAPSEAE